MPSQLLIQGFFFQEHMFFGIAHRAESEGGVGVILQEGLMAHMWSGVIYTDPTTSELTGELMDDFGESILTNIKIGQDTLTFSKRYHQRIDEILYTFRKRDGYWIGEYSGEHVGKGVARCILNELPDAFFAFEEDQQQ